MSRLSEKDIVQFQEKILSWYSQNKRELPWRDCFDPYKVLVSEVMLQQTQVDRVVPKFLAFIDLLPDFSSLATADKHTLLSLWSGLGFNSRALRLQQAADMVLQDFAGVLPDDRDSLLKLPGIGKYCSASIRAFAFNLPAPVVDTNIRRVLIAELDLDPVMTPAAFEDITLQTIPEGRSNDWFNALMDYGSLVATAVKTGIKPLSKQSTFKGSAREARGMIVRYLLKHKSANVAVLQNAVTHERFDEALAGLLQEQLIVKTGKEIHLE